MLREDIHAGREMAQPTATEGERVKVVRNLSEILYDAHIYAAHTLPKGIKNLSHGLLGRLKNIFTTANTYGKESIQITAAVLSAVNDQTDILRKLCISANRPLYFFVKEKKLSVSYFIELSDKESGRYTITRIENTGKKSEFKYATMVIIDIDGKGYRGQITFPQGGRSHINTGIIG